MANPDDEFLRYLGVKPPIDRDQGVDKKKTSTSSKPSEEDVPFDKLLEKNLSGLDHMEKAVEKDRVSEGLSRSKQKKPARNKEIHVDLTIDLHSYTLNEARQICRSRIKKAVQQGLQIILVIVGKGKHSPGGPVLKSEMLSDLKGNPSVSGVMQAPFNMGGSGAYVVYLNKN